MRVVNKLTKPGDIRRVDLSPDFVRIQLYDNQERIYKLSFDNIEYTQEAKYHEDNVSIRS